MQKEQKTQNERIWGTPASRRIGLATQAEIRNPTLPTTDEDPLLAIPRVREVILGEIWDEV